MIDAAPGKVGNVQQTVRTPQIYKGSVRGEILDPARQHCSFGQLFTQFSFSRFLLFLQDGLAADHHVASLPVYLDDPAIDLLPHQRFQVSHRPKFHLGSGEKGSNSDINDQAPFHPVNHATFQGSLIAKAGVYILPRFSLLHLAIGNPDRALFLVVAFHEDIDLSADLDTDRAVFRTELIQWDRSLGPASHIHDGFGFGDLKDGSPYHLAGGEGRERFHGLHQAEVLFAPNRVLLLRRDLSLVSGFIRSLLLSLEEALFLRRDPSLGLGFIRSSLLSLEGGLDLARNRSRLFSLKGSLRLALSLFTPLRQSGLGRVLFNLRRHDPHLA